MKKISVFYHAYMIENSSIMGCEQLRKIINPKWEGTTIIDYNIFHYAYKLYIGVVDPQTPKSKFAMEWLSRFCSFSSSKEAHSHMISKIDITVHEGNKEESDTMKMIAEYASTHPDEYVLYFHMKGITKLCAATEAWRRYMEYFVIEKWRDCITKLDEGYDCCGVMWNKDTPIGDWPHFSGNFWWATTNYINTLEHSYLDHPWRYMREFWIGSNPDVKAFEFHNSHLNDRIPLEMGKGHYDVIYDRKHYAKNE